MPTYKTDLAIHGWAVIGYGTRPVHILKTNGFLLGRADRHQKRWRWSQAPYNGPQEPQIYETRTKARNAMRKARANAGRS